MVSDVTLSRQSENIPGLEVGDFHRAVEIEEVGFGKGKSGSGYKGNNILDESFGSGDDELSSGDSSRRGA